MLKTLKSLFKSVKKEGNPVNYSSTSMFSGSQLTYSVSDSTRTTNSNIFSMSNSFNVGKSDTWITDGAEHYNLTEICRQFTKMQTISKIAITPIDQVALLMTDEDPEVREIACLYYEKFKSDLKTIKEGLSEK